MRGTDLVVQARTGTGKTAAFGLPLVDSFVQAQSGRPVQALVLCPTRELALQVTRELERDRQAPRHQGGGRSTAARRCARQIEQIRETVLRFWSARPAACSIICRRGTLEGRSDPHVRARRERRDAVDGLPAADQRDLGATCRSQRQTLLFSATLPPDIQRIAETRLKKPEFITLSGDHIGALRIQHFVYMTPRTS